MQPGDIGDAGKSIEKARKAGQQQAYIDAESAQRRRQCGGDVTKPAGLGPGIELRCDMKHSERRLRVRHDALLLVLSGFDPERTQSYQGSRKCVQCR